MSKFFSITENGRQKCNSTQSYLCIANPADMHIKIIIHWDFNAYLY